MKTITYNPETHKLVPIEPTEEMVQDGCDSEHLSLPMLSRMIAVYKSMLNAAPAAEEAPGQDEDMHGKEPTWTTEQCDRVVKTLRYIEGIAERGEGRLRMTD